MTFEFNSRADLNAFVGEMSRAMDAEAKVLTYPGQTLNQDIRLNRRWLVIGIKASFRDQPDASTGKTTGWNYVRFIPGDGEPLSPRFKSSLERRFQQYTRRLAVSGSLPDKVITLVHLPGSNPAFDARARKELALVAIKPPRNKGANALPLSPRVRLTVVGGTEAHIN